MARTRAREDDLTVQWLDITRKFEITGVEVTATAAEINALDGITSTVAELNALDGITAIVSELNLLDNQVASCVFVVGTEGGDVINVGLQFKDAAGADMATPVCVPWYFSSDAAGLDPLTTAHDGGTAIGTDGALIESVANLSGVLISEADGDADINITDAGAFTAYLVIVLPTGALAISAVITHAS